MASITTTDQAAGAVPDEGRARVLVAENIGASGLDVLAGRRLRRRHRV